MSEEDIQTVVIDCGSYQCRVGFNDCEKPKAVYHTVVEKELYGHKKKTFPIQRSSVTNWDDLESIWHSLYKVLSTDPSEHPVLLCDSTLSALNEREKMMAIMFDTFNVPSFYVENQDVLSLYTKGLTTGIVLRIGGGTLSITPVIDGKCFRGGMEKLPFAGCDITDWLSKLLFENGNDLTNPSYRIYVRDMKEKLCFVSLDYDKDVEKSKTSNEFKEEYVLPNGKIVNLNNERFQCGELLFKPFLSGIEYEGIDKLLFESINKCPMDRQKEMYGKIVLSGGSAMFKGLKERLEKEITDLAPPKANINIDNDLYFGQDLNNLAWCGGAIVSSVTRFPQMCVTKDMYEEEGPSVVHRYTVYY